MFQHFEKWAARPFDPEMGLAGWVAFFLMIFTIIILWTSVLRLITKA